MTQEQLITNLETLLPYYIELTTTGNINRLEPEHQPLLKQTFSAIYPVPIQKVMTNCFTCVSSYLNSLNAQYEKITGKVYKLPQPEIEAKVEAEIMQQQQPKTKKKK